MQIRRVRRTERVQLLEEGLRSPGVYTLRRALLTRVCRGKGQLVTGVV
jgi:hypothetical protein